MGRAGESMAYNVQQFFLQKRGVGYVAPILCTMRGLGENDIEQAVVFHKRISD